ncbi:metalloregulator ArsR/SmtB family transcription factor [Lyngbya aestuarii]|uniref:metalloregulator ArsR/SmtB family transcription factor n=1 Tax=Lyngbya aestuarii TaxID=118322 RepID=UPI00403DF33A
MRSAEFSRTAKALADPRRFEILEAIAATDESACTTLVEQFPVSQATISHHLKELANAHLIIVRREGQHCYYRFCPQALAEYIEELQRRTHPQASLINHS